MLRRPPRSTQSRSSAASDVYKRQFLGSGFLVCISKLIRIISAPKVLRLNPRLVNPSGSTIYSLSLIHISEPTRPY